MGVLPRSEADDVMRRAAEKSFRRPSHTAEDLFASIEKAMQFRFKRKEANRSNLAVKLGKGEHRPICPTAHGRSIAWSGPPHDIMEGITCLDCGGYVSEPEMQERGYDFRDCPDYVFFAIMDEKAEREFRKGNPLSFFFRR